MTIYDDIARKLAVATGDSIIGEAVATRLQENRVESIANASASNNSIYYSTDNSCLMWKDSGGNYVPIA